MERFWSKVNKKTNSGCWEWTARKNDDGYGTIKINNKQCYSHRFSWQLFNGFILKGLFVLHKCDNPSCVNPDHLFLGTKKDNAKDRDNKGRGLKGRKKPVTIEHGRNRYVYHKCRCIVCRIAERDYYREYRKRKKATVCDQ